MVGLSRFELLTPRLSSVCSNQLSYRPGILKEPISTQIVEGTSQKYILVAFHFYVLTSNFCVPSVLSQLDSACKPHNPESQIDLE